MNSHKLNTMLAPRYWRREMLVCALLFQVIFLVEVVCFRKMIIVDPNVHIISYENWGYFIHDWQPPAYWTQYFLQINGTVQVLNVVAQVFFWVNTLYVWFHRERFGHSRPAIAAEIVLVTAAALAVRWYIKYHVDFYRLFMYSIYPELLMLLQLFWALRAAPCFTEKTP